MRDIQDCLTRFNVAVQANDERSKAMAVDAIDAYVARGPADPERALKRLKDLEAAYVKLRIDGSLALVIREAIERRIAVMTFRRGQQKWRLFAQFS